MNFEVVINNFLLSDINQNPVNEEGNIYILLFGLCIEIIILYELDVCMASPTCLPRSELRHSMSPTVELHGASRVTGGVLRGRAYGNVFNHADADGMMDFNMGPRMGRVHIFMTRADPMATKPDMVLKHEVTSKLKPILKSLARGYSPIRSKLFTNL